MDHAADESAEPISDVEAETSESDDAATEAALKREARLRDKEVRSILRQLLDELIGEYASDNRGVEIREIAGGYRMATKPECHDAVRAFVKSLKPALKLSLPALETLAVVAYKQPVTAPEVNEIRGVDSSGVFGSLLARKLIATAGRKQVIGRPILYKTTKEFLLRFGLKDVAELPSMEEFEKMAAIELDEPELAGQSEAAREIREDLSLELDAAQSGQDADASDEDTEATTPEAAPAAPPPTE
jgi:segregation and condensation protein B